MSHAGCHPPIEMRRRPGDVWICGCGRLWIADWDHRWIAGRAKAGEQE